MTFDARTGPEAGKKKGRKGFAAMDPEKVRAIAATGGKKAHAAGTAHEFTSEEGREAGRRGGYASAAKLLGITLERYMELREEAIREGAPIQAFIREKVGAK